MTNHRHGDQSGGVMDIREVLSAEDRIQQLGRTLAEAVRLLNIALEEKDRIRASLPAEAQGDGAVAPATDPLILINLIDMFGTASKDYGVALQKNPPGGEANKVARGKMLAARERVATHIIRAAPPAVKVPTEAMLIAARDWSHSKYGKAIGNEAAIGCWTAMLSAAPTVSAQKGEG